MPSAPLRRFAVLAFSAALAILSGCGSSAAPGSPTSSPSTGATPDGGGGTAACGGPLAEFCASGGCPKTWADAQVAAHGWCTTPPAGVDSATVSISSGPCTTGYLEVSVGEFGGPIFFYDAASRDLVAVYEFSDTAGPECIAGTPVASGAAVCATSPLCTYGEFVDAGTGDDASGP